MKKKTVRRKKGVATRKATLKKKALPSNTTEGWREGYKEGKIAGKKETATIILDWVSKKLDKKTRKPIADFFNVDPSMINNFANGLIRMPVRFLDEIARSFSESLKITPVCEYEKIDPCRSGDSWNIHCNKEKQLAIKQRLDKIKHAIYVFYSSAGTPTYVGKTTNSAFTEIQARLKALVQSGNYGIDKNGKLRRYDHSKKKTKTGHALPQGDITKMISVYSIDTRSEKIITNLEALMIRSFINAIENNKIQEFV